MEAEKISVIIPVYNAEKYLRQCLKSVCVQTYKNLEIILVNDGSTDGSLALCEALAAEDGRITVLSRQNGGAAAARNTGLEVATGEYIGFIDSDDYIEPDMYEKLYNALTEAEADMSECDFAYVDGEGKSLLDIPPMPAGVRNCRETMELVEFEKEAWRYISLVNRLYRRKLFDNFRLVEGKICEDEFAAHPIYSQCRRIAFISDVLYWDVCRANSVMTSAVSLKRLAGAESRLERYEFYRRQGWNDLARSTVRKAYATLWLVIKNVNVWNSRGEIKPYVRSIVPKLLRHGDILRAGKIQAMYWLYLRRGKAEA